MNNLFSFNGAIAPSLCTTYVEKMQQRILAAYIKRDSKLLIRLQNLQVSSEQARQLAVRHVLGNQGAHTPGVDGVIWDSPNIIVKVQANLKSQCTGKDYKAMAVKRVWIPKPGKAALRPLGIPTLFDRAMQALWAMAQLPISEYEADPNSYGSRPGRSTHDALFQIQRILTSRYCPRIIKGFFDNINHQWIMENIPIHKVVLSQWLKAGILDKGQQSPSESGVPQGGIISPMIANMVLDGLEDLVKREIGFKYIHVIRYMDDFIINNRVYNSHIMTIVERFQAERGLTLNKEKTLTTEISQGFNFLGVSITEIPDKSKTYGNRMGVIMIRPTEKAVANIKDKMAKQCENKNLTVQQLIQKANPIIQGWANYYRYYNSSAIFRTVDQYIRDLTWKWVTRKFPKSSAKELYAEYFKMSKGRQAVPGTGKKNVITDLSRINIIWYRPKASKAKFVSRHDSKPSLPQRSDAEPYLKGSSQAEGLANQSLSCMR